MVRTIRTLKWALWVRKSADKLVDSRGRDPRILRKLSAMKQNKTYNAKPGELHQKWLLVDATEKIVGRLASEIAVVLMGKHRPTYTPHVDTGDFVVVVNAEKISFTGKKWQNKEYTWYTGYPGQRSITAEERLKRQPELILREAVRRMLPKNKLGRKMLSKLKVYAGPEHPHQAQSLEPAEFAATRKPAEINA